MPSTTKKILLFCLSLALLTQISTAFAGPVNAAQGVTFEVPPEVSLAGGQPSPVTLGWKNADNTLSLNVIVTPVSTSQAMAAAKEFQDWPGAGRSFVAGFGEGNSKNLKKALNSQCKFTGVPQTFDPSRTAFQAQVDTTCDTEQQKFELRTRLIQVLTRSNQVIFRIDSNPPADADAQSLVATVWKSLTIANDQRIEVSQSVATPGSDLAARPVSGGAGVVLRDYGLVNTAYLMGNLVGGLIVSVLLGALIAFGLMKVGVGPLPAVSAGQIVLIFLKILGSKEGDTWVLDPVAYVLCAGIAFGILLPWAKRWAKRRASKTKQTADAVAN